MSAPRGKPRGALRKKQDLGLVKSVSAYSAAFAALTALISSGTTLNRSPQML